MKENVYLDQHFLIPIKYLHIITKFIFWGKTPTYMPIYRISA